MWMWRNSPVHSLLGPWQPLTVIVTSRIMLPAALEAVTLNTVASIFRSGLPLILPLDSFMVRPSGSAGLMEYWETVTSSGLEMVMADISRRPTSEITDDGFTRLPWYMYTRLVGTGSACTSKPTTVDSLRLPTLAVMV